MLFQFLFGEVQCSLGFLILKLQRSNKACRNKNSFELVFVYRVRLMEVLYVILHVAVIALKYPLC